jgi:predicted MFS family arabinose efflux permease
MGGMQALFSLATILGPGMAGIVFEKVAISAPYWLGCGLVALSLAIAVLAVRSDSPQ